MICGARVCVAAAMAALMSLAVALAACGGAEPTEPVYRVATEVPSASGPKRRFAYQTLDGRRVGHLSYAGRMTLIAFVATYDTASQAQARFVNEVVATHAPRINALLLVLEPPHHAPLVEAFVQSLDLRYDVAMADAETIAGEGPFTGLHHVPSVVLLDREGREVWRNLGVVSDEQLRKAIERRDPRSR